MKKIIGIVLVIAIFIGIGFGVKRFIEGPPQSVNGLLVIGTEKEVNKVKQLYKNKTKQTVDYKMKFIVTKKGESNLKYAVINKTTAEQFVKKGIIRARKDPNSLSIISEPVYEIKELNGSLNLLYSFDDKDMVDHKIELNGQMIPVHYVKHQAWVGYIPMDLVILNDPTYDELADPESIITLFQLNSGSKFDYKDKEKTNQVFKEIKGVYSDSEDKVNFVDIED
ncbi:lipoprotein BA_5634 family protein [Lysinibacillus xylanilyticus]|uniref:lipoprotein BA_5634 family protein n=1 Tax=Lysinibacillus xylanilyticus TaxID=582475 RepID=UPI00380BBA90